MRTITCNGHSITLEVNAHAFYTNYTTKWDEIFIFNSGESQKVLTRREYDNHGSGDDAWYDEISYNFLTFSLAIDGVQVVNKETYNSAGGTDSLYYDQVQMNNREFTVNGKVFKIQIIRDLY